MVPSGQIRCPGGGGFEAGEYPANRTGMETAPRMRSRRVQISLIVLAVVAASLAVSPLYHLAAGKALVAHGHSVDARTTGQRIAAPQAAVAAADAAPSASPTTPASAS